MKLRVQIMFRLVICLLALPFSTLAISAPSGRVVLTQDKGTDWGEWNVQRSMLMLRNREEEYLIWQPETGRIIYVDLTEFPWIQNTTDAYWNPIESDALTTFFLVSKNQVIEMLIDDEPNPAVYDVVRLFPNESNRYRRTTPVSASSLTEKRWTSISNRHDIYSVSLSESSSRGIYTIQQYSLEEDSRPSQKLNYKPTIYGTSPEGQFLFAANKTDLTLWGTQRPAFKLNIAIPFPISKLGFSQSGNEIAVASADGEVVIIDLRKNRIIEQYTVPAQPSSISFGATDRWLVATNSDNDAIAIKRKK